MARDRFIVCLITSSGVKEARKIARILLREKQAACVNLVSGVDSLFRWKNKIDKAKETLLIVKSREKNLKTIVNLIRKYHSYTVPEIIALPVMGGFRGYLDWVREETTKQRSK